MVADPGRKVQDHVAILDYARKMHIPVPEVLAFVATSANQLSLPYTVLEFLDGRDLGDVYSLEFSLEQKISLVTDFVQLLVRFESAVFPQPGRLTWPSEMRDWTRRSVFNDRRYTEPWSVELGGFRSILTNSRNVHNTEGSALSFLQEELRAWRFELAEKASCGIAVGTEQTIYTSLHSIFTTMSHDARSQRYTSSSKNVLYHWDLEPRNIKVRREGDKRRIVGVIDWDDAVSVPVVLARKPPNWLWDDTAMSSFPTHDEGNELGFEGNIDSQPETYTTELEEDALQIKKHFETTYATNAISAGNTLNMEEYIHDAYGPVRWLRWLWQCIRYGYRKESDINRVQHLERVWREYLLS